MKLTVKYCTIHEVEEMQDDVTKRKVTLMLNEEDLFEMLDGVNKKNIIKYLDMRNVNHREAPVINIYECKSQEPGKRNRRKLDRCLAILDTIRNNERL